MNEPAGELDLVGSAESDSDFDPLYQNASKAMLLARLGAAKSVAEAKPVLNYAAGMRAYAKQAKNKELEADAWEIRQRAERRLDELRQAQAETVGLSAGTRLRAGSQEPRPDDRPTLTEAGIDKNLAKRIRAKGRMAPEEFEDFIVEGRADVLRAIERSIISKLSRQEKHQAIAAAARMMALANGGPFPLIYADPPWKWGHFGEIDQENERGKGRTPDQHYPTLTYEEIKNFHVHDKHVSEMAHKDAALLLWCTSANVVLALDVMEEWDFEYKAQAVWVKDKSGTGLVFRNKHEVLLYGTRGNMPGPQYQPPSVFHYPRGEHSAKPPEIRTEIEKMYPDFDATTRLEIFARSTVPGWTPYGFEANREAAE